MISEPKKMLPPSEIEVNGDQTTDRSKTDKAKLTVFVNARGIQVGAKITLRDGQEIRLSMDEAIELKNLLSPIY